MLRILALLTSRRLGTNRCSYRVLQGCKVYTASRNPVAREKALALGCKEAAEVIGSNGGSVEDIAECYKLMASGELDPEIIEIGFEEIAEGLNKLKKGGIKGRMVVIIKDEDR